MCVFKSGLVMFSFSSGLFVFFVYAELLFQYVFVEVSLHGPIGKPFESSTG